MIETPIRGSIFQTCHPGRAGVRLPSVAVHRQFAIECPAAAHTQERVPTNVLLRIVRERVQADPDFERGVGSCPSRSPI